MTYRNYLIKRLSLTAVATTALAAWATTASILALRNQRELVLVGIDANGTRVITASDDPLFRTEVVNFLKEFTGQLYTFTPETFEESVGRASDLMSAELWNRNRDKILKLKDIVTSEAITSAASIQAISKLADGRYTVALNLSETRRVGTNERRLVLTIALNKVERNATNPYGIEVSALDEEAASGP